MNPDSAPVAPGVDTKNNAGPFRRSLVIYERQTGQSVTLWATLALLNLLTQAAFFRAMVEPGTFPGEFGTLNAALGIIGLLTVPVLALSQAFRLYPARSNSQDPALAALRESSVAVTSTFAWIWSAACLVLIFLPFPLPYLPRYSLQLFALMNVLLALSGVISSAICESAGQLRRWAAFLIGASVTRLVLGAFLTGYHPLAEAALAAFLVAGFITLIPALRPSNIKLAVRLKAFAAAFTNRQFLLFASATISVLLGVYLFTNADRIAAIRWMDVQSQQNILSVEGTQVELDTYQATGLFARALLWGTQPLLWLLYAERSSLNRTTSASLKLFWIYLSVLLVGAVALGCLTQPWSHSPLLPIVGKYGPTFAVITIPLGLLQGIGIFSLASRRFHECFVFGGSGIVYLLILTFFGRRPDLLLPYMFGSSVVCVMIVLFVGVVRWGRKQP